MVSISGKMTGMILIEPPEGLKIGDYVELRYNDTKLRRSINQQSFFWLCIRRVILLYARQYDPTVTVEQIAYDYKSQFDPVIFTTKSGSTKIFAPETSEYSITRYAELIEFMRQKSREDYDIDWTDFDNKYPKKQGEEKWEEL